MKEHAIDHYITRKHKDYSSVESRKKILEETFRNNAELYRKSEAMGKQCDSDRSRIQRRIRSAERYMDHYLSLYDQYCPQIDDVFYPAEDYARIVSVPFSGYDDLEREYELLQGAAYWILDELNRIGKTSEAIRLLDGYTIEDMELVRCMDVGYSYDTVSGILHILMHRNDDCKGYRTKQDRKRIWIDDLTVKGKQHQDVPSRNQYEKLLKLIPEERIRKAVDLFEKKSEEAFIVYLKCRHLLAEQEDKTTRQIDKMLRRIQTYDYNTHAFFQGRKEGSASPVMISEEKLNQNRQAMFDDYKRVQRYYDQYDAQINEISYIQATMQDNLGENTDWISDVVGEDRKGILSEFTTEDPTALCFACLYLIDTGSDLPWMYYPGASIMSRAGQSLPWYGLEYDELEDPVTGWEEGDPVLTGLPDMNQAVYYEKDEDDPEEKYTVTLNQIIYELCGNRFPGNLDHFGPLQKKLDAFDLNEKERLFVLCACIVMYTADHQIEYSPVFPDLQSFLRPEEKTDEEESTESLKQTIREQKQELEALQATAHRLQKMYADQYRKYQNLEAKSEEDTKELAELREIFFSQNNDVQEEEKISITLPYEVKESTTVFGGHPSWQKEIVKDLTGNIRFIDTNKGYDEHIIRHSECIWLQTNAMSHSDFYKIVSAARKYHIPFHYFQYASAQKCAQQVAQREQETL